MEHTGHPNLAHTCEVMISKAQQRNSARLKPVVVSVGVAL